MRIQHIDQLQVRSKASLKREETRNSLKTIEFKNKIAKLLEGAEDEIAYSIKRDLSVMTSMPFYKDRPQVIKVKRSSTELILEYAKLFITCDDKEFIETLIKRLSTNQGQTIRKAASRIGEKKDVWEHVIPARVITKELIKMVLEKD